MDVRLYLIQASLGLFWSSDIFGLLTFLAFWFFTDTFALPLYAAGALKDADSNKKTKGYLFLTLWRQIYIFIKATKISAHEFHYFHTWLLKRSKNAD